MSPEEEDERIGRIVDRDVREPDNLRVILDLTELREYMEDSVA